MIFMGSALLKELEILPDEATKPFEGAGFGGGKLGQVSIFNDVVPGYHANGPAGKTPRGSASIVYPMNDEFGLAAENPVPPVAVHDAKGMVKPAPLSENAHELLQDIQWGRPRFPFGGFWFHFSIPFRQGFSNQRAGDDAIPIPEWPCFPKSGKRLELPSISHQNTEPVLWLSSDLRISHIPAPARGLF
jgi:hypothetical protein